LIVFSYYKRKLITFLVTEIKNEKEIITKPNFTRAVHALLPYSRIEGTSHPHAKTALHLLSFLTYQPHTKINKQKGKRKTLSLSLSLSLCHSLSLSHSLSI